MIIGAMLVSRCGDILSHTLLALVKRCDRVFIIRDNIDCYTYAILNDFISEYGDKLIVRDSNIPRTSAQTEKDNPRDIRVRFMKNQRKIRQMVFDNIDSWVEQSLDQDKPSVVIWPDSDELLSNGFDEDLSGFILSDKTAMKFSFVDICLDFKHLKSKTMDRHYRVFKWVHGMKATERRFCLPDPLDEKDTYNSDMTIIHMAAFGDNWLWRKRCWSDITNDNTKVWILPKDAREMSPKELRKEINRKYDLSFNEFINMSKV